MTDYKIISIEPVSLLDWLKNKFLGTGTLKFILEDKETGELREVVADSQKKMTQEVNNDLYFYIEAQKPPRGTRLPPKKSTFPNF